MRSSQPEIAVEYLRWREQTLLRRLEQIDHALALPNRAGIQHLLLDDLSRVRAYLAESERASPYPFH